MKRVYLSTAMNVQRLATLFHPAKTHDLFTRRRQFRAQGHWRRHHQGELQCKETNQDMYWKLKRQKFLSNPILAEFPAIQFFFVHFTWYMFYSIKYANQRRNKNDMDDNNCQPRVFSPPYHLQLFLALSSLLLLCSSPGPELRLDFQELQN